MRPLRINGRETLSGRRYLVNPSRLAMDELSIRCVSGAERELVSRVYSEWSLFSLSGKPFFHSPDSRRPQSTIIAKNSSSEITGMPSSFAFLFFPEVEVVSLLIRKLVFADTEPLTFPPRLSIFSFSSLRLAK